jgi:hypothetical protein
MSLIDQIIRISLALGLSLLSAIVLGVLTRVVFWVASRVWDTAAARVSKIPEKSEYSKEIRTAIIGGIVGGVAFAAMTPVVTPFIFNTQVETGIVDEPEPDLWVQKLENPGNVTVSSFGGDPADGHDLYILNITNDDNRPLQNYNMNIRFRGCVETATLGITNQGAAVMSNESQTIQVGEFPNRPANSTCYGAIQFDDLVPQNSALVTFVVDPDPEKNPRGLYPRPTLPKTVLVTDSYTWDYSGRTYANGPKLQVHPVNETISNSR